FTALSCDNLSDNGAKLRRAVLDLAAARDPAGADWIAAHAAFPGTMVDRIVPAPDPAALAAAAARLGLLDRAALDTETFGQWVIEDRFSSDRPDLAAVPGVVLTHAVAPWEQLKLRLLNGAHSAISYLGGLHDITFVHEVMSRPEGRALVEALWNESAATLVPPPELDLPAYRAALLRRFGQPVPPHRTAQIAIDGSRKLPQRLLAPIADRLDRNLPADALCLAVAAWMRWQGGRTRGGTPFAVEDPVAPDTARILAAAADDDDAVSGLLALRSIFPGRLAADPRFVSAVSRHYRDLAPGGAPLASLVGRLQPAPRPSAPVPIAPTRS
ncbi:MAG: mannitol dehydrogenase family protein, partial [Gluconacetobacter diazotrophicus]|nr:mannitol dehydrogenase family protein [Gluconacetobacter diazotrophicus]